VQILPHTRREKSNTLLLRSPRASFAIDGDSAVALEYFMIKAIPFMRYSKPSPLWNHMLQLLHQEDEVIRKVAAAICQQQRSLEDGTSKDVKLASGKAYGMALQAHCQALSNPEAGGRTTLPTACLLLVILESLRGSFDNVEYHLQACVVLLQQQQYGSEARELLNEVSTLIESFIISTMSSSPLTEKAVRARKLLRMCWATHPIQDNIAVIEQSLAGDMVAALDRLALVATSGKPFPQPNLEVATARICAVQAKQEILEAVAQERIDALQHDDKEKAYYGIVLARSLTNVIFIKRLTGASAQPEVELETWQKVVDLCETSLAQLQHCNPTRAANAPNAFSVGLGVIPILYNVGVRCKDFYLRRRALLVLERCPRREGIWTVEMARFRIMTIIKAEEAKALYHPGRMGPYHLPEDCHIAHNEFVMIDGKEMLRLFWRKPGSSAYITENVHIRGWKSPSYPADSPPSLVGNL
jgi:hypothetical protein